MECTVDRQSLTARYRPDKLTTFVSVRSWVRFLGEGKSYKRGVLSATNKIRILLGLHLELLFYSQRPSYNSNLRPYRYEGSLFKRVVLTVTDCLSTVHSNVDAFYEQWYMLAQLAEDSPSLATEWLLHYCPYIPMTPGRDKPPHALRRES